MAQDGRGRTLTPVGHELVGHARRILDAHRHALLSLKGSRSDGLVRLAATQDFAESGLPELLALFSTTHPRTRIDLRIGRSVEIGQALAEGATDVGIIMRGEPTADEVTVIAEETVWWASASLPDAAVNDVPLALLDPPCGFRARALNALERDGRAYRIAATSQGLAGLRIAVLAGLAVTLRSRRWRGVGIAEAPTALWLPAAEPANFAIHLRREADPAACRLAELVAEGLPRA